MTEIVGSIGVKIELVGREQLDRDLQALQSLKGGQIALQAVLDTRLLRQQINNLSQLKPTIQAQVAIVNLNQVESQLKTLTRDRRVRIGIDFDGAGLDRLETRLGQLANRSVKVGVDVNDAVIDQLNGKLNALSDRTVRVGLALSDNGIEQKLNNLGRDRSIRFSAELDNNGIDQKLAIYRNRTFTVSAKGDVSGLDALDQRLTQFENRTVNVSVQATDTGLSALDQQIKGFGDRTFKLSAIVDDSQLTALNKHLDLKQRHWTETVNLFRAKPIASKVDDSQLTTLNQQLDQTQKNLQDTSSVAAIPIAVQTDISQLLTARDQAQGFQSDLTNIQAFAGVTIQLEAQHLVDTSNLQNLFQQATSEFSNAGKQVGQDISKQVSNSKVNVASGGGVLSPLTSIVGNLGQGISIAIGQKISAGFSQQANGFLEKIGAKSEQYVVNKAKAFERVATKDLGYEGVDALRKDIGRLGQFADTFIDPEKVRAAGQKFEQQLSKIAVDFFVNQKSAGQIFKEFSAENPLPRGASEAALRVAGYGLQQVAPALRINKDVQLAKAAKQVEELVPTIQIDPVRKREIEQSNAVLYATGGLNNAGGKSGAQLLKPQLERIAPGAFIQPLSNEYRDTNAPLLSKTFQSLLERSGLQNAIPQDYLKFIDTGVFSGATPEVIRAAAEAKAYQQATNKPVYGVGYSAGGADVADLVRLGELTGTNIKGVGLGAPITGLTQRPSDNFVSLQGSADATVRGLFTTFQPTADQAPQPGDDFTERLKKSGLVGALVGNPIENTKVVEKAGLGHSLGNYLASTGVQEELQTFLPGILPEQLSVEYQNKGLKTFGKQGLDFALEQASKRPDRAFSAIQDVRDRPPTEAGLDRGIENLRKIHTDYRTTYKSVQGSVKAEVTALLKSLELAISAFEELKGNGGSYTAQYRDLIAQSDAAKKEYQKLSKDNLQAGKTAIFAKRDFKDAIGVGGTKVQELVSNKQDSALANAQAIAKTVTVDTSEEFAQFQQKIASIGAGLEPLLEQAKNIEVLPTAEIVSLYEQISNQFNREIDQLERLTDEFANQVEQKPAQARKQVAEILPTLNRRKALVPLAQEFGVENADKLNKKELIGALGQVDIGALQPKVLEVSRNQAQQRLVRQERNAAIAQTAGNVARGTVEGAGTAIREVAEASKKAASVFRIMANSEAGQAFIGGVGNATKGLFAIAKTSYKIASFAEGVALDALPFGRTAKGILQQTALPAATFAAATHFLPGGQVAAEGLNHLVSGAVSPLIEGAGNGLAGQATGFISHAVPNVFGLQGTISGAVSSGIQGLTTSAGELAVNAGTVILGGKLIQGTAGKAGVAALQSALPQDSNTKALPAASNKALPQVSARSADAQPVPIAALPSAQTKPVAVEPQVEIAKPFEAYTNPQLLAATRKLGIKGTNTKTPKDNLIERLKAFSNQSQVDQVLAQVEQEIGRDGKPIAGFNPSAEKDAVKRLSKAEKDINRKLAQLQNATGKKREKLINEILSGTQAAIVEIDGLKGQNLSGETLRSLSGTQGRIENTVRNNPTLNAARNERNNTVRTVTIEAQSARVKGLARASIEDVEPATATLGTTLKEGFRKLTNFAAKQFEVQPQPTIKGTLGAIAKSPKAIDLAVNTAGFAASQVGAKYGVVPELFGDIGGALVARQLIARGRVGAKDLTGDIAGFGVGNIAARSLNAGLDALTGVVPGAGVLRALPFKGAIAASLTVPKVQKAVEPFQEPPLEGLARVQAPTGLKGLAERFKALLPNNQKKAAQIRNNYEAIYDEIVRLSGAAYNPSNIPKLSIDGKRLKQLGAQAFFDIEQNTIVIDNTIAGILSKRTEELHRYSEQLKSLTHEGRHSVQLDGGKLSLEEAATGRNVDLLRGESLTQAQRTQVAGSVEIARRQGARGDQLGAVKKLETDATAFESNTGTILKNAAGITPQPLAQAAAQKGLINELGSALSGLKQKFQEGVGSTEIFGLSLNKLGSFAKTAIAGFVGFQVLSNVVPLITQFGRESVGAAIKLDNLKTALSFSSGGAGNAAKDLAFIRGEATRLGVPLGALQDGFVKLSASTKGTALAGQVTKDLVTGLGQASTTLGLSAEESGGAILALSQIASKGSVQAEELRGQLGERIPGAFGIAARAMGVTEGQLNKLLETGSVTADEFLPKLGRQLQIEFAGSAESASKNVQSSFYRLGNSFQQLQEKTGKVFTPNTFAVDGAAKGIDALGNSLGVVIPSVITFGLVLGVPLLAPLFEAVTGMGRAKIALDALGKGFNAVKGNIGSLALKAGISTIATLGAIEAGRTIGEVFSLDEEGKQFEDLGNKGQQNLERIAEAAKRAKGEIDKVSEPKKSTSKGFDFTLGLASATGLDQTGFSLKSDDLIKLNNKSSISGFIPGFKPFADFAGRFSDPIAQISSRLTGGRFEFRPGTTVEELQQQRDQISFNRFLDQGNNLAQQAFSGQIDVTGKDGKRQQVDIGTSLKDLKATDDRIQQLRNERGQVASQPKADKVRVGRIDDEIQRLTTERAQKASPLLELQASIQSKISDDQNLLKDDKLSGSRKDSVRSEIQGLENAQALLNRLQNRFETAADTVSDFKAALNAMNVELEQAKRNADLKFSIDTTGDIKAQIENFGSDINASIKAPVQAAIREAERSQAQLEDSRAAIERAEKKAQKPGVKSALDNIRTSTGQSISLDSSVKELEDAKAASGQDEAKKKLIDELIDRKRALDQESELEQKASTDRLNVRKAEEQAKLALIQKASAERESQIKRDSNTAQIGLLQKQKAGNTYESDIQVENAKQTLSKGQAELDSTKQQLDAIESAYAANQISAEEYEKQRREIGDRISDQEVQNAQNEVALVKATEQAKLSEIDRAVRKREALIKQSDSRATVSLVGDKTRGLVSDDVFSIAQAKNSLTTTNAQQSNVQTQLDEIEQAYARGIVKKEEYEKRSQDLTNSLADLSVQKAQNELALREAIDKKAIESQKRLFTGTGLDQGLLGNQGQATLIGVDLGESQKRLSAQQTELASLQQQLQSASTPVEGDIFAQIGAGDRVAKAKEIEERINRITASSSEERTKKRELELQRDLKLIAARGEAEERELDRKKSALDAELKLSQAVADSRQSALKIGIDRNGESVDAFKQLQGKNAGYQLSKVLKDQLTDAGFNTSDTQRGVIDALQNKQALEAEADREKVAALLQQQALERESVKLGLQKEQISARTALLEARQVELLAKKNLAEAQGGLAKARRSGNVDEIQSAQEQLKFAKEAVGLAGENKGLAELNVQTVDKRVRTELEASDVRQGQQRFELDAQNQAAYRARRREAASTADEVKFTGQLNFANVAPSAVLQAPETTGLPSIIPTVTPNTNQVSQTVSTAASTTNNSDVVAKLEQLYSGIIELANKPRSLTFNTPDPVSDYASYMNNMAGQSLRSN